MQNEIPEKIWNLANILTLSRIILAFIIVFLVLAGFNIFLVILFFALAMLTDIADGWTARRFKITTEFGRKFDMIADRILMGMTVIALVFKFTVTGTMTTFLLLQIFLIATREIISVPFAFALIASRNEIPRVKVIGKLTTFLQGITFPLILLNVYYPIFSFSIYFAGLTAIVGLVASIYFINDVKYSLHKKQHAS